MKFRFVFTLFLILFAASLFSTVSYARQDETKKEEVIVCPVSGEKINKANAVGPFNFKGVDYFFCCNDCMKKFQENPEKYTANMHHSCTCISTEKKTDFKVEHKSKTYYFCDEKCKAAFEKDPEGFLAKMKNDKEACKEGHKHDGCSSECQKKCSSKCSKKD